MDYSEAIAIADDVHWVGRYDPGRGLQCNAYLLHTQAGAVLIDPGSMGDFPVVFRKVLDLITPEDLRYVVVAHQDPDVVGSLPVIAEVAPEAEVVAHRETARLLEHIGLRIPIRAVPPEGGFLPLADRTLEFVATPFLHSPGAMATWDTATRSLFTGDLFGAVGAPWSLFAEGAFESQLTEWHEVYMASQQALVYSLDRLMQLDPERVCPQHGSVLVGDQVARANAHLRTLRCGIDRLVSA